MPWYEVKVRFEASRIDAAKAKVARLFADQDDMEAAVRKVELATSRSARFDEAESDLEGVKATVGELKDELETWKDSLPENLQDGQKADEIQSAIDELESLDSALEGVDWPSIEFPGMY